MRGGKTVRTGDFIPDTCGGTMSALSADIFGARKCTRSFRWASLDARLSYFRRTWRQRGPGIAGPELQGRTGRIIRSPTIPPKVLAPAFAAGAWREGPLDGLCITGPG